MTLYHSFLPASEQNMPARRLLGSIKSCWEKFLPFLSVYQVRYSNLGRPYFPFVFTSAGLNRAWLGQQRQNFFESRRHLLYVGQDCYLYALEVATLVGDRAGKSRSSLVAIFAVLRIWLGFPR
jgi:hypothetical protein